MPPTSRVAEFVSSIAPSCQATRIAMRTPRPGRLVSGSQTGARHERRNLDPIAVANEVTGNACDPLARHKDSHQVQGIGCGNGYDFVYLRKIAGRTQGLHGRRQRELFPDETADEASSANFAAVLQAAVGQQKLAPLRYYRLSGQQIAEDHAVAVEQHPAGGLDRALAIGRLARIAH